MASKNRRKPRTPPPPPAKPQVRVVGLDTASGILKEMGRVYRASRQGKLDVSLASKFVFMLGQMGRLHETVEIERRVLALETRQGAAR